jgi:hypothetical protein
MKTIPKPISLSAVKNVRNNEDSIFTVPFDPGQTIRRDRLTLPLVPNQAQNGNQGSILAYSLFGRFMVTGLIGALLIIFFRIPAIRTWNPKSPFLRGGKPALLFPFGWQIAVQMGWSRGKTGKRGVLDSGVFFNT